MSVKRVSFDHNYCNASTHVEIVLSFDLYFSQWSDAMLSNLLYCQGRVAGSGSGSDLEAEWKKLYPASLLTARSILKNMLKHVAQRNNKMDKIGYH